MSPALSRIVFLGALAALLAVARPAQAQEMGLDLSDGPDLRPSLAILGLATPVDVSAADRSHADKLAGALVAGSRKTGWFGKVLDPADVIRGLGDGVAVALACDAAECLADAARQLGADRVVAAQMSFPPNGPLLKMWAFDAGTLQVEEIDVAAQGKPAGFDRAVALAFKPLLQKISTPLGTLKVVPDVAGASVEVNGRLLGVGTVEKAISAGTLKVRVTAADHLPFEVEVTLDAKGTAEVAAKLVPRPVVLAAPTLKDDPLPLVEVKQTGKPVYARPGLYMAIVGAAAVGVGAYYGVHSKGLETKGKTPDSENIVDVTRVDRSKAKTEALIANVLMGAGAALVTGGVIWFALEPAPSAPGKGKGEEPTAPKGETVGFLLRVGGEF